MTTNISAADLVPGQSGYYTVVVPYDGQADINEDVRGFNNFMFEIL